MARTPPPPPRQESLFGPTPPRPPPPEASDVPGENLESTSSDTGKSDSDQRAADDSWNFSKDPGRGEGTRRKDPTSDRIAPDTVTPDQVAPDTAAPGDVVPAPVAPARRVYTVSSLNREVRARLEGAYRAVWVSGEISNLSQPRSGHVYFTLKDAGAQVRCAMFRNRVRPRMPLRDGLEVVVRAQLSLYELRGEYQLIVETLEETGEGALRRAFEALKRKLQEEGLFAAEHKRLLPRVPRRIGVVTSPTGAAIRDILQVLRRRFPAVPVRIYPTPVQGAEATGQIVHALRLASERGDCDVLIVGRGGGSLEDLWAFNDERVARAIRACRIPVVSAVGHEVDVTIADFAADVRAPTPSAAAEQVVPDALAWLRQLRTLDARLSDAARRRVARSSERLRWVNDRLALQHPAARLGQGIQRTDELAARLHRAMAVSVGRADTRLGHLRERLAATSPRRLLQLARERLMRLPPRLGTALARAQRERQGRVAQLRSRLLAAAPTRRLPALEASRASLTARLHRAVHDALARRGDRLAETARTLTAVSPLATLARGYAIVRREQPADEEATPRHPADGPRTDSGAILRSAEQVAPGDRIVARLGRGRLYATVDRTARDTASTGNTGTGGDFAVSRTERPDDRSDRHAAQPQDASAGAAEPASDASTRHGNAPARSSADPASPPPPGAGEDGGRPRSD